MPSLRELLQMWASDRRSATVYALLKALVEAVEPEKHTCGECAFYNLVRGCTFAWPEGGQHEAHASDDACGWHKKPENIELAEAKAEIERLRNRVKALAAQASCFQEVIHSQSARLEEWLKHAQAHKADAELGRLVRGMRPHSRIIRGGKHYWPELLNDCGTWQQARRTDRVAFHDPAEALRAIQETANE